MDRFDTSRPDQVTDVAGWTTVVASMRYLGLDRFGRIVETIWIKGTGDVVQGVYGRNRSAADPSLRKTA